MNYRFLFLIMVLVWANIQSRAAIRTISSAGGNFNNTAAWVEGVVPTSADTVFATSGSGSLTVNVASSAKVLDLTSYLGTITFNANLTVGGDVTLDTGLTTAGAAYLVISSGAVLTSRGKTLNAGLSLTSATGTYTLADDWTVSRTVQVGTTTSGTQTINGNTLYCSGSLTVMGNATSRIVAGTTYFVLNGKGTVSSSGGLFRTQLTINTSDTITFSGNFTFGYDTLTYLSGVVRTSGSTLTISNGAATIQTTGINWNNFVIGASTELLSDLSVDGLLTVGANINGNYTITASGGLVTTASQTGTLAASIVLDGKGTWSSSGASYLRNTLIINTSDTITVSGTVYYGTDTLRHISGVVRTNNSTLTLQSGNVTINTNGVNWNNVSVGSIVLEISSPLSIDGTLTLTGATLNGAAINCSGGLAVGLASSGTSSITFDGTGTWSGNYAIRVPITINTSGTITISGQVAYNTGTLSYVSGTVVTTGSTLNVASSTTFNTQGVTWNNVVFSTGSITMSSDLSIAGTLTLNGTTTFIGVDKLDSVGALVISYATLTLINDLFVTGGLTLGPSAIVNGSGMTLYVSGGLSCTGINVNNTGNCTIVLNGTGTISSTLTTAALRIPLTINTTGTITISGNVNYNTTLLKRINGTVNGSGTIVVSANTPIDFNGGSLPKLNINATGVNVTLQSALTITSALNITGTAASQSGFVSSSPGTQRVLILQPGATQDIAYGRATDMNSSGGQTIFTYKGTLSNSSNWKQLAPSKTIAHVF